MKKLIKKKQDAIDFKIQKLKEKALIPLNKIIDLRYEQRLLLAKSFIEKEENHGTKKEPLFVRVKFMKYDDYFSDKDTGEVITIERHERVEVNGKRCYNTGHEIKPLTEKNI